MKPALFLFAASCALAQTAITGKLVMGCFTVDGSDRTALAIEGARLDSKESSGTVTLSGSAPRGATLRAPKAVGLKLSCSTGTLTVSGVTGEMELDNVNGGITVTGAESPVTANTAHGWIEIGFEKLPNAKPLKFTSVNGSIELTLPAGAQAKLKMRSNLGEVRTDFELKPEPTTDGSVMGTINGGGVEITLTTLNGNIHVRERKPPEAEAKDEAKEMK